MFPVKGDRSINGYTLTTVQHGLRLSGFADEAQIVWNDVTLQDEVELARARLYDAQAKQLLRKLDKEATA